MCGLSAGILAAGPDQRAYSSRTRLGGAEHFPDPLAADAGGSSDSRFRLPSPVRLHDPAVQLFAGLLDASRSEAGSAPDVYLTAGTGTQSGTRLAVACHAASKLATFHSEGAWLPTPGAAGSNPVVRPPCGVRDPRKTAGSRAFRGAAVDSRYPLSAASRVTLLGPIAYPETVGVIRNSCLAADPIPPERDEAELVHTCGILRRRLIT